MKKKIIRLYIISALVLSFGAWQLYIWIQNPSLTRMEVFLTALGLM